MICLMCVSPKEPSHFAWDALDGCEIHFAPPKNPWNDLIPLQIPTSNGFLWFQFGAKWILSVHGITLWERGSRLSEGMAAADCCTPQLEARSLGVRFARLGSCNGNLLWMGAKSIKRTTKLRNQPISDWIRPVNTNTRCGVNHGFGGWCDWISQLSIGLISTVALP